VPFKIDKTLQWDVLELHLDEAAFLWQQWERTLDSPLHLFPDLARGTEWRLRASLSALTAAGRRAADRLLRPAMAGKDLDQVRVAAAVLLAPGEGQDVEAVLKAYGHGKQAHRPAIARALELAGSSEVSLQMLPLLDVAVPFTLVPAIRLLAFRRAIPEPTLARLLNASDPSVAAAALAAARYAPGIASAPMLEHALRSTPAEQEAALVTGLVSGYRSIWGICSDLAGSPGQAGRMARVLLAMGGDDSDLAELIAMLFDPTLTADTLWALGFSGRVAAADACLPWMEVDDGALARLAGEAFAAITGLSLSGPFLRETDPKDEEDGLGHRSDPIDIGLTLAPEAQLPLPENVAVASWWEEKRPNFDPTRRYLSGRAFDSSCLIDTLLKGPARRRHMLALELAIRSRGAVQVETRAFASAQLRQLALADGQRSSSSFSRPFAAWMSS